MTDYKIAVVAVIEQNGQILIGKKKETDLDIKTIDLKFIK